MGIGVFPGYYLGDEQSGTVSLRMEESGMTKCFRNLALSIVMLVVNHSVHADLIFSEQLTSWSFSLNNGVAYITSAQLPANCLPQRARINMSGSEYDKALFTFALDAKNRGATIRVVVDDSRTDCVVMGIQ